MGAWEDLLLHEMLSAIEQRFRWFTEGFDTQDLNEAKALLDELGRFSQPKLSGSHSAGRARRRP
jgi:hypothetical protein